jgi:Ca-activated chloride channel family protein
MNKKSTMFSLLIIVFLFFEITNLYAVGALFSRPRWSNVEYEKMWIKHMSASIDINEQIAVTRLDQTYFNEMNESVEAIFIFPLPDDATITELIYWVNGERYVAEIKERQAAVAAYNQRLQQWLDPALLEYLGDNLFRLSIVPIDPLSEVRTEITYIEPLKYEFGKVEYKFQLNTVGLSSQPLETVAINLSSKSKYNYQSFISTSHENSTALQIVKLADNHYTLFYGDENFYPDRDLVVKYETDRSEVEFSVLTYTPSVEDSMGEDSFYAMWITSPDIVDEGDVIPQNIVFAADVSSSMEGTRLLQLKEAMYNFIDLLGPEDSFNIVTFGTFIEQFQPDLTAANETNKQLARDYVAQLYALGLTNIDDALKSSLTQSFADETHNSIIFLTDGEPTWGETNPDSIIAHTQNNNMNDVRIFSIGIGETLSKSLLENIASVNHGYSYFIENDDSIALVVGNLFKRISKPVLTDISLDFGGLNFWDTYPKLIPDLYWGSQLMFLGKYSNSGNFSVSLNGKVKDGNYHYITNINFPDTIGGHRFVPRLWARAKINSLLDLIERFGENDELVNQIIELSLTFGILTPYTAFYADPDVTSINDRKTEIANNFSLNQNYPNPFNPSTTITYELPAKMESYNVVLKIYNSLGELVKVLVNQVQGQGVYSVSWNGKDMNGFEVPSGIYFYTLEAGNIRLSKKMMLLR